MKYAARLHPDDIAMTLEKTCDACPEQYDVRDESGKMIAYIRLRHGHFRVMAPDVTGKTILDLTFTGEAECMKGEFEDDERPHFLALAELAIRNHYRDLSENS